MNYLLLLCRYDWFIVHHKIIHSSYQYHPISGKISVRVGVEMLQQKTKRTGNEKGSDNYPAFLANVAVGHKGKGQGESVCHEECTKPPNMTPKVTTSTRSYPQHIWPWLSIAARYRGQNRGSPSLLFVCHLLTLFRPCCGLLIRFVIDNFKCQSHPEILHRVPLMLKLHFQNWEWKKHYGGRRDRGANGI